MLSRHLSAARETALALGNCGLGSLNRTCLSIRDDAHFWMSRDNASLEQASWSDFIEASVHRVARGDEAAASELETHRDIYRHTHHRSLLQTTPRAALSLTIGVQKTLRVEGLGNVPVLLLEAPDSTCPLGVRIGREIRRSGVALVRGAFAITAAQDLEEASRLMCLLEQRAQEMIQSRRPTCG